MSFPPPVPTDTTRIAPFCFALHPTLCFEKPTKTRICTPPPPPFFPLVPSLQPRLRGARTLLSDCAAHHARTMADYSGVFLVPPPPHNKN